MITGSKELIRDINTRLVLETIVNSNAISRAAIAKHLGLTKATISAIVQELIGKRLVIEIGSDDTSHGRKPILLSLNKKAAYVVCIDIGESTVTALLSDLAGEDCVLKRIKTPKNPVGLAGELINLIESMKVPRDSAYGLAGITLGIHGVVTDNKISFTPYYNLAGIDLAKQLHDYFETPIYLENEANLSVIGEKAFMYDYSNMAYVSVHSGIGTGLIINDRLYSGFCGRAGEFGHTIIEPDGMQCPCGNRGCLEQYASERSILAEYARKKGLSESDPEQFMSAYEGGDPDAVKLMDEFVKYMSIGVNNILNAYNPEIVIINSPFTKSCPELLQKIEASLSSRMNSYIKIVPGVLQDSSILLGGCCIAIKGFLGIENLKLRQFSFYQSSV